MQQERIIQIRVLDDSISHYTFEVYGWYKGIFIYWTDGMELPVGENTHGENVPIKVTHWMPIPEPPKEDEGGRRMTNYEYLKNISLPKLAVILGYIADTNPKDDVCCPLKKLGKCKYITESELNYDCCESWCDYLMDESTETDRKFWSDEVGGEICFTQRLADKRRAGENNG